MANEGLAKVGREPKRILLVGDGAMAAEHARSVSSLADAAIVGVVGEFDAHAEAFARRFGIDHHGTSLGKMLELASPDVVIAAVSLPAISNVYRELLNTDVTLLLEKPFGLDVDDARELHSIAKSRSAGTFVAMNRRQYGNLRRVHDSLMSDLGPRFVQILDQETFAHPVAKGYPSHVVERWMYANAIHLVDLLIFFSRGSVTHVESSGWRGADAQPQLVTARVEFDSGDTASYEALWSIQGPWSASVTTPDTRWEMRPIENARSRPAGTTDWLEIPIDPADEEFKPGTLRQAQELLNAARGLPHTLVSVDDAMASISLLSQIYTRT
jgi:predicted dehydrogenase